MFWLIFMFKNYQKKSWHLYLDCIACKVSCDRKTLLKCCVFSSGLHDRRHWSAQLSLDSSPGVWDAGGPGARFPAIPVPLDA